ncbi:MAG: hypothetical protein H6719_09815 [Sandaracinaceae bacterium]|nr:hypothetical protein [Sandaracinaceae bacterium]
MPLRRDDVPIEARCSQRWSDLRGSGRTRHCAVCETPVTHLSLMPEREARAFLAGAVGTCVAYRHHPDGTIVFADRLTRRAPTTIVAGAALLAAACSAASAPPDKTASPTPKESPVAAQLLDRARDEACRRQLGAERRAAYRAELAAERDRSEHAIDCDLQRQLLALGYVTAVPASDCPDDPP